MYKWEHLKNVTSSSYRVYQCIFIVHATITNMNRLFLISGIAVFVAAIFLIPNTPNTTMAYSCSSSSGTQHTNAPSQVSGSSGSCSTSSSASTTSSGQTSVAFATQVGPHTSASTVAVLSPNGAEAASSSSSGGAQSSCSSSSAGSGVILGLFGATSSSTSISQPGHCP
jgi:hypothetical protein